jgi:hypothetical protein
MSAEHVRCLGTDDLCQWLKALLDEDEWKDAENVLKNHKVKGKNFLNLTLEQWMTAGLHLGVADSLCQIAQRVIMLTPEVETRSLDEVGNINRRNRFKRLNHILEEIARKKAKGPHHEVFDAVKWNDIEEIYAPSRVFYNQPRMALDDEKLATVYRYMELASKCFGDITTGKEAKRLHFIAPILVLVCSHFDDVEILVEHDVNGIHIKTKGHFEFVLKRGNRKVCIVEAKKDNLEQGMAQNLLGCEAIADVEELDCALGTNHSFSRFQKISLLLADQLPANCPVSFPS